MTEQVIAERQGGFFAQLFRHAQAALAIFERLVVVTQPRMDKARDSKQLGCCRCFLDSEGLKPLANPVQGGRIIAEVFVSACYPPAGANLGVEVRQLLADLEALLQMLERGCILSGGRKEFAQANVNLLA